MRTEKGSAAPDPVVENLLDDALRYSPTGSNIAVRTRRDGSDEAQGGGLAVEETDGGRATFATT